MPDNAQYYHAAYAVVAAIYLGYIASLRWRARKVRDRLASGERRSEGPRGTG